MRTLLLVALLGLALTPLAAPPAAATSCTFLEPSLNWVVCRPIFLVFCAGQEVADGATPKGIASCALP